jgi:lysophospholipase L1-like esterase
MLTSTKNLLAHAGFWLMLPISAIQGLRLRTYAIRLPEATGDKAGVCGIGEPLHLLAIGDSIIAGVGTGTVMRSMPVQFAQTLAEHRQCSVHWRVEGSNGADISHLRKRVRRFDDQQKADVLLISIGVNDVTGLSSTRHWRKQLKALTMELRQRWPNASVIFAGLPPMSKFPLPPQPLRFTLGMRAATLDAITARLLVNQANMLHVPTGIDPVHHDFCEDGFHPSADACRFWAEELAQRFKSDTLAI